MKTNKKQGKQRSDVVVTDKRPVKNSRGSKIQSIEDLRSLAKEREQERDRREAFNYARKK